jgi:hypothetical protein
MGGNTTPAIVRAFTVPTAGSAYRFINWVKHHVLGDKNWPRPNPDDIDSTQSLPIATS